ncbi:MAG: hydroxymethylbilane synthase, partial [Chlamydiota bacterium]|nr:hydroxymethylbilane synthase [Chlamydiota bacterium]
MKETLVIGTRPSKLARWQADFIRTLLKEKYPELNIRLHIIKTQGDRNKKISSWEGSGLKGLFTKEISDALLNGSIDAAVHSMKDLPSMCIQGLMIGAVPVREDVTDIMVSKENVRLDNLPASSKVGTVSLRRKCQLHHMRNDLNILDIRGNVPTRIRKVLEGPFDAVVLAKAGLKRLGLEDFIAEEFMIEQMLPSAGQGALAVEIRSDDASVGPVISSINDADIYDVVMAEKALLHSLGGDCRVPVGAYGVLEGDEIALQG